MSKSTKVIAALGVAAGLGVASLPAATFAATAQSRQVQIQANVSESHTISVDDATKSTTNLNPGATDATLSSTITIDSNNPKGYSLTVAASGNENHVTDLWNSGASSAIAAFSSEQTTLSNETPGWGGKLASAYTGASGLTATGYNGFTTTGSQVVYSSNALASDIENEYVVNYGIALAPNQATGQYSGAVTYTLSATE